MALFLKILADIAKQQKFIEAGPLAGWLWLAGLGHCRLSSTDGFIPKLVVPTLVPGMKGAFTHAATLVRVGLWEDAVGGYQVHDYFDFNPSKAELDQLRREDADRKRLSRRPSDARGVSARTNAGVLPDALRVRADAPPAGASSPSPSADVFGLVLETEEIPISTVEPSWRTPTHGNVSIGQDEAFHRRNCAPWAIEACLRGVCIAKYDWPKWQRRFSVTALQAFVEVWAERAASAGDPPEKFWPLALEAHFGTAAPQPVSTHTKGARAVDAFARAHDAIQARKAGPA